jgi:hypothetical protein
LAQRTSPGQSGAFVVLKSRVAKAVSFNLDSGVILGLVLVPVGVACLSRMLGRSIPLFRVSKISRENVDNGPITYFQNRFIVSP